MPQRLLDPDLLQRANCWLSRRLSGHGDELLIVGTGFINDSELRSALAPYGLGTVDLQLIDVDTESQNDDIGLAVAEWLRRKGQGAIPIVLPSKLVEDAAYNDDGWWWSGISAANVHGPESADVLVNAIPSTFANQASSWAEILVNLFGSAKNWHEADEFEAALVALTLARWLAGFDAACESNSFDFSYKDAALSAGLDLLRLGFEAGRDHAGDLEDAFSGTAPAIHGLVGAALKACLEARTFDLRDRLSEAFGGDIKLYWTLRSIIWPKYHDSVDDSLEALGGLQEASYSELEFSWNFVREGWAEVED